MADPSPQNHGPTAPLPSSPLFHIRSTPHSGRAVFASRALPPGTLILRAEDLTLNVLLREYRREVCAWCFAYAHGRELPVREEGAGMWFCGEVCLGSWRVENGGFNSSSKAVGGNGEIGTRTGTGEEDGVGIQAWKKIEELVRLRTREDSEMVDMDVEGGRPDIRVVRGGWKSVERDAELIRGAREAEGRLESEKEMVHGMAKCMLETSNGTNGVNGHAYTNGTGNLNPQTQEATPRQPLSNTPTKAQKRAVNKALQAPLNPDILSFLLSGLLSLYHNPSLLPSFLALTTDPTPYHSLPDLEAFLRSYLHLLCILPPSLLSLCTPANLRSLSERDSHNSFGIRSLEDDGSEFFGFGCWPSASYFNHSCAPNVTKRRVGRGWEFWVRGNDGKEGGEMRWQGVREGEELCISYLSGEERLLGRGERMRRLERNWGFECGCEKCNEEIEAEDEDEYVVDE